MEASKKFEVIPENQLDWSKCHFPEPDYSRPPLEIPWHYKERILDKLIFLYGVDVAWKAFLEIERLMKVYYAHKSPGMIEWEKEFKPENRFTEKDVILITYGDLIRDPKKKPLETLEEFCSTYLKGTINTLHILPFFPYSSDRGFAVMDFEQVDPTLGTWDDILRLKKNFRLMFDGVFNHVSSKSRWFQEFLNQNPDYEDFFIVFSTKDQLSEDHLRIIVRPRTSEVLTPFRTLNGERWVWTTFSPDQIDLNYRNHRVLEKMVDILLYYVRRGADILRLDAVTYLWTELGTECVHLQQTHAIIKLFRDILNVVAPHVAIITETNVPHAENITYFGNGEDEAQMVYNFALPPLVLHTFQTGDATELTRWAASLETPSPYTTFFNFLDSHDGIGVMAVRNILTDEQIEAMAMRVLEHGGFISYKRNGDGSLSPYELNITWFSAINREDAEEPVELQVQRYLASRSIALVLQGVPGVYLHGLLGSKNDADAVLVEKQRRSINRKNIDRSSLFEALENPETTTHKITNGFVRLIKTRIQEPAFHPNAPQRILALGSGVFAVLRTNNQEQYGVLCLTNVTPRKQEIVLPLEEIGVSTPAWYDLISRDEIQVRDNVLRLTLKPYGIYWLKSIAGSIP